jgi:hypothetical protein
MLSPLLHFLSALWPPDYGPLSHMPSTPLVVKDADDDGHPKRHLPYYTLSLR